MIGSRVLGAAVAAILISSIGALAACSGEEDTGSVTSAQTVQSASVALVIQDENGARVGEGTGILLAPRVVLTAAHLVAGKARWTVTSADGKTKVNGIRGVTYDWMDYGDSTLSHPRKHDVAVIYLDNPIQLSAYPRISDEIVDEGAKGTRMRGTGAGVQPISAEFTKLSTFPHAYVTDMPDGETLDTGGAVLNDRNEIVGLVTGRGMSTGKLHIARTAGLGEWLAPKVSCGKKKNANLSTRVYGTPPPKEGCETPTTSGGASGNNASGGTSGNNASGGTSGNSSGGTSGNNASGGTSGNSSGGTSGNTSSGSSGEGGGTCDDGDGHDWGHGGGGGSSSGDTTSGGNTSGGTSGTSGNTSGGTSGTSGNTSGGTSGTSGNTSGGTSGTSGNTSGGTSGTSGNTSGGTSGTSGNTSGGTSGTSGNTSGGTSGTSGNTSGGTSGTSGNTSGGTSGTSGNTSGGTSGTSGNTSGGTSGTSGGTSGTSGSSGASSGSSGHHNGSKEVCSGPKDNPDICPVEEDGCSGPRCGGGQPDNNIDYGGAASSSSNSGLLLR